MSDHTCQEMMRSGGPWSRHDTPCGKRAKAERNGRWYCGTHDPHRREALRLAREREDRANMNVRMAGHGVRGAEQTLAEVVAVCEAQLPNDVENARQNLLEHREKLRNALDELRAITPEKANVKLPAPSVPDGGKPE